MHKTKLIALIASCVVACGSPSGAGPTDPPSKVARTDPGALTMRVARASHSAIALADGRVLLIGGCVRESCEAGPDSSTVDIFDPRTNRFEVGGSLLTPRVSTSSTMLPNGQILIAGGWAGSGVTDAVEMFDWKTGRSRRGPNLSSARADMAAVQLRDGRVLLAGGYDGERAVGAIDLFDPRDQSLRRIGSLTIPRTGAGAALLPDGRVLVIGGGANGPTGLHASNAAEIVDPSSGLSKPTGSLADARYKHAVIALRDGGILAIGGSDERDSRGKLDSVERYDPATARFTATGRLGSKRYKIGNAVVLLRDGRVLIAGGAERSEVFDPSTGRAVQSGPQFGGSLNFASATLIAGGEVLIAGGYYEDGIRMNRSAWLLQ